MSGKSASRHLFELYCPNAFFNKHLVTNSGVIIEDMLQIIKPIKGSERYNPASGDKCILKNGNDFANRMRWSFQKALKKSEEMIYYVMMFDKSKCVPITKGVEQNKRDKTNSVDMSTVPKDGINFKDRRPYISGDKPLPADLSLAISDRDDTLMEIISFLNSFIISYYIKNKIPSGKNLVIDGHCLKKDIAEKIGVEKTNGWSPSSDYEAYCTPIVINHKGAFWFEYLHNEYGEVDFTSFYIYDKLCEIEKKTLGLDIYSIDTDTMLLGLVYISKRLGVNCGGIYWRYEPKLSWVLNYRDEEPKWPDQEEKWVELVELYKMANGGCFNFQREKPPKLNKSGKPIVPRKKADFTRDIKGFTMLKSPILTMVTAIFTIGGDFIDKLPLITHETAMKALECYSSYIGDIVEVDRSKYSFHVNINGQAYVRFVKSCYIIQKDLKGKDGRAMHPSKIEYEEINDELRRAKRVAGGLPDLALLRCHARHLLYYLCLVFQIGDEKSLKLPNPLLYSYGPVDSKKPLARNNIKRIVR